MNSTSAPSAAIIWAQLLPKMAAVFFLLYWVMPAPIPLERLAFVIGTLALIEAVTVAAARKTTPVLDWNDLGSVGRCLVAPGNLPVYALLMVGMVFFANDSAPGWRRSSATSAERVTVPPARIGPSARPSISGPTSSSVPSARPSGTPSQPVVNFSQRPKVGGTGSATPPTVNRTAPVPKFAPSATPPSPVPKSTPPAPAASTPPPASPAASK